MLRRDRLISLRKALGKTQSEVADDLFLSVSAYSSYERGLRQPSFETLSDIADYFGVNLDYLLGKIDISFSYRHLDSRKVAILKALPELSDSLAELMVMAISLSN